MTLSADACAVMPDATVLGHLLHKHPDRVQYTQVHGGTATVLYPEASTQRCTVALLLDVDPTALTRGKDRAAESFTLAQYVNDRPYAATSLLSVALGKVFRTALKGRSESYPQVAASALDLTVDLPALRGDGDLLRRLFEPLGWAVETTPVSPVHSSLRLAGRVRLADALGHLYVLIPVLDDAKHYWVSKDEVDKLLAAAGDWLPTHPERAFILRRYLAHQRHMVAAAVERLDELDDTAAAEASDTAESPATPLVTLRHEAVLAIVDRLRPRSVLDLGCGSGSLLPALLTRQGVERVAGTEVSDRQLQSAARRLHVEAMTERQGERVDLWLSSLGYEDERLTGFDLAIAMEVIEHIDPARLPAVAANLFGGAAPAAVVLTTPNREYNVRYPALFDGGLRHRDHRFEWTRAEFADWCAGVCAEYDYDVQFTGAGEPDPALGRPTQIAVLTRREAVR